MGEASIGQKISWFLYQKGMGTAKADYIYMTKPGEDLWFKIAEVLIKDKNIEGRSAILDQLLQPKMMKSHPKRMQFLGIIGHLLSKGLLDERRKIAKYIDAHPELINVSDDIIWGPLMTAQRDSDVIIANTAESAVLKIKGENSEPDIRRMRGSI